MALQPDDETILVPAPIPAAYRFRSAVLTVSVPKVDSTGVDLRDNILFSLSYNDPTLTDPQRAQFMAVTKFIVKKNGGIA